MSPALRIPEATVRETLARVLLSLGFAPPRAEHCARLFAEASMDGVASHGLARFPRFVGQQEEEYGVSQIFLAFDVVKAQPREALDRVVGDALEALHRGDPAAPDTPIRYPGERVLATRAESRQLGVLVDAEVWEEIQWISI